MSQMIELNGEEICNAKSIFRFPFICISVLLLCLRSYDTNDRIRNNDFES